MVKRVSLIFLVNQKKGVLFQLRDDKPTIPWPNYWGLLGGEIEGTETPKEAIIRETFEEINYKLGRIEEVGNTITQDPLTNQQNFLYFFRGEINLPIKRITLNEGQKLSFFNSDEITQQKIPPHIKKSFQDNMTKILGS